MSSHYDVLQVPHDASFDAIKRAYQRALLTVHPDKTGGEDRGFAALQDAWKTLGNAQWRAAYDEKLRNTKETKEKESVAHWVVRAEEMQWDENKGALTMACRCGGVYIVTEEDEMDEGIVVVPCSGCSYKLQVDV
jgi:diphthamide biosynthesis protein 4